MGKHYGDILYKSGVDLSSVILLNEEQKKFGSKCLPLYEKYLENIMQEVKGMADGLHQKYEDLAFWLFSLYCYEEDHGCSVIAVKTDNDVIVARNMDMFPEYKKTSESVLYMPENKNTFLAHSTAFISVEDGINEHGLSVALTFLMSKRIKPGINGGFIVRLLLEECKTTKEAVELLKKLPISSTHNIVIADKLGNMVVAEICPDDINIIENDKYVIATNHFVSDKMKKYNNKIHNWYYTNDRYNTLKDYLENNEVNFEIIKKLISNNYGFVCNYEKSLHFDTIWSAIYSLNTLYNEISEGNPIKTKYKYDNRLEWGISKKH